MKTTKEQAYEKWAKETHISQIISTRDAFEAGWDARNADGMMIPPEMESLNLVTSPSGSITPESIYALYPRKVGRGSAIRAIERAYLRLRKHNKQEESWMKLEEATLAYADAVAKWPDSDRQYIPHPATWFNADRFLDDRKEWVRGGTTSSGIKAV